MRYYSPDELSTENLKGTRVSRFGIAKAEVGRQDFLRLGGFFGDLKDYGSLARQKVLFSFASFDDDERELIYIPEVVSYARTMIKHHPYFWYTTKQHNSAFLYLAFFVSEKDMTITDFPAAKSFFVKQDASKVANFIQVMAMSLKHFRRGSRRYKRSG